MNYNILSNRNQNRLVGRKCSFCNNIGHNVTKCDDNKLCTFKRYLFYVKNQILSEETIEIHSNDSINYVYNSIRKIEKMEEFLYNYCSQSEENTKIIKTFACRFGKCRLRTRMQVSINKIIVFLFDLNYSLLLNHSLNNTPFSEENPISISCLLNDIITNYQLYNDLTHDISNDNDIESTIKFVVSDCTNDKKKEIIDCSICFNEYDLDSCITFNCDHNFCSECAIQLFKNKHVNCPNCRTKIIQLNCYNNEILQKFEKT